MFGFELMPVVREATGSIIKASAMLLAPIVQNSPAEQAADNSMSRQDSFQYPLEGYAKPAKKGDALTAKDAKDAKEGP